MLDDTLVALVGSSIIPDATFLLTLINPDGSNDPHYFSATSELLVEHYLPRADIHQFDYLSGPETLSNRVQSLLSAVTNMSSGIPDVDIQIGGTTFGHFMDLVQARSLDRAEAALIEAGVATTVANKLLGDYTRYPSWVGVAAWNLHNQEAKNVEAAMVIGSDSCCWLLENMTGSSNQVRLRKASRDDCFAAIADLIQSLKQTYQPSF
jgi:hypothetical protein